MIIAGVDIGNNTTEIALAKIINNKPVFLASGISKTTGIKGTPENVVGIRLALEDAVGKAGIDIKEVKLLRLNEATPVIADVAMEAITETIITESTMIGHNPSTPGGVGLGVGKTTPIFELTSKNPGEKVIAVVPKNVDYEDAARLINRALERGIDVQGAIVQKDDGVLISNRLKKNIPIVDEVSLIEKVPLNMLACVEVAEQGFTIKTLSNPYGIASVFNLSPEETKNVVPIARALIGNRSAVVIKTPQGDVQERKIPAGSLKLKGQNSIAVVDLEEGAEKVMKAVEQVWPLVDAEGTPSTNVGGLISRVKEIMAEVTFQNPKEIRIQDILAVDTLVHQKVTGGIANEFFSEDAVAIAAMVKSTKLPMEKVAERVEKELNIPVEIAGVEANMAILGALTTPGTDIPVAILDLGGGSTDAALMNKKREVTSVHLAGAGEMVNMLIAAELGISDKQMVEDIKRYPVAKVESLFSIRLEDGTVRFFDKPLDPRTFARVCLLKEGNLIPLPAELNMEKIREVRRNAKKKVFVTNAIRALSKVAPSGNIRLIDFVIMVGGSALDFEIPEMISDTLANYGIVAGRGNIRGTEGPRNAVATGLVLSGWGK
ncbi:diol dehydratase reactivase alpha subunit [Caldanaerovirga acetigignens]|uniref:Diol dehydratase reactivase alpha subunit n=1 Tax=Caldanaerovirga acetigignens TaxID=447595 RepID=A0A1M7MCD5_9FIRM|nr:diol dehydratase reactivase subunit alpha [Caldanaerovirga acetigignens]SHM88513.1 diol dehydratase reactivase alpha subunit [Caldanaerovirga acetigignens]